MKVGGSDQKVMDPSIQKAKTSGQEVQYFKPSKVSKPVSSEEVKYIPQEKKNSVSKEEIFRAVEKANERVMSRNTELRFSIHDKTNEVMIKVMNTDTQEVIREIPSEKILDMVANFMEMAGLYIDEEA